LGYDQVVVRGKFATSLFGRQTLSVDKQTGTEPGVISSIIPHLICPPRETNPQLTPNPLQLFQNHEELLTGLAKTLTKVSNVLPQIEIQLDLYDELLMQLAAEKIYTHFIELFHEMVKFYEESPLKHAWKSFSAPLSVRFAPIIDAIDEQSQTMRHFASALAKREQRLMLKLLELIGKDVSVMAVDVSRLADAVVCEFALSAVIDI
jgi:hypothetical protein